MKTFKQFNENAKSEFEKFLKTEILKNPEIQKVVTGLKSGNINLDDLKNLGNNKEIKQIPNKAQNLTGKLISSFGQSMMNK
mgnify:CR=1 FL=1|tara:strand:- start:13 stop:255 length:243 start_codon:yes stop_codon:yes gene_type:complete